MRVQYSFYLVGGGGVLGWGYIVHLLPASKNTFLYEKYSAQYHWASCSRINGVFCEHRNNPHIQTHLSWCEEVSFRYSKCLLWAHTAGASQDKKYTKNSNSWCISWCTLRKYTYMLSWRGFYTRFINNNKLQTRLMLAYTDHLLTTLIFSPNYFIVKIIINTSFLFSFLLLLQCASPESRQVELSKCCK